MTKMTLYDMIHADLDYRHTYDMPLLRFQKEPIKVFLWDDMQDYTTFMKEIVGINQTTDYRYVTGKAFTEEHYLPWYNMSDDGAHPALCLSNVSDLEDVDMPEWMDGDAMPLTGKVVSVSLKALHLLDCYYENEVLFSRQKIKVRPQNHKSLGDSIEVFAYFNALDDVANYSSTRKSWIIPTDRDIMPFKDNGGVYEM